MFAFFFLERACVGILSKGACSMDRELDEDEFCRSYRLDADSSTKLVSINYVWGIQLFVALDSEVGDTSTHLNFLADCCRNSDELLAKYFVMRIEEQLSRSSPNSFFENEHESSDIYTV
jgi:hypothetical protein